MRAPSTAECLADLRALLRRVGDDLRLYVLWPLLGALKATGRALRDLIEELRSWVADGPEITPAKARFVEYGIEDSYLGSAWALHDRMTDRLVGPFVSGELEDVANTLETHPQAYADEEGLRPGIDAGRATSVRVVLPEVLL